MLLIKKDSAWQFVTSSSGGIGIEFVMAEGGTIMLKDPSGSPVNFTYGAAGAGLSAGLKLPKIGKLKVQPKIKGKTVGGGVAPAEFPNLGKLYILDWFQGDELKRSDITGVCAFAQVGGGLIGGGSAYAMVLGMSPLYLAAAVAASTVPGNPLALMAAKALLNSATSVLLMAGLNVGLQAGGGGGIFLGGLV